MSTPVVRLRPYQQYLCNAARGMNAIVLLPTGAGKTLVAAEIIKRKLEAENGFIVFFVPTCFLVEQQAAAIRGWLGERAHVVEYHGGRSFPELNRLEVLVSTPQAFRTKQATRPLDLGWERFALVVFDEVHHVLKDHPYRKLALSMLDYRRRNQRQSSTGTCRKPQVLGLTALLTYAVSPEKIEKAKDQLCRELGIEAMPHVSKEDLQRDGFHAGASVQTEVRDAVEIPDIFQAEKVVPEAMRKPHLMHTMFWDRVRGGEATAFAAALVDIVRRLESYFIAGSAGARTDLHMQLQPFTSPLGKAKLASWGECAHERAAKCAEAAKTAGSEKRELHDHAQMYLFLEHWYEALRIVVQSWEEPRGCELAVLFLTMMGAKTAVDMRDAAGWHSVPGVCQAIRAFLDTYDAFPHFEHLVHELLRQKQLRPELRALVFVQQKTTAHVLAHHLNADPDFRDCALSAVPLHSTTTGPPTASLQFSRTDEMLALQQFSTGARSVLVTTTVAEEGMDVGAANCVVRFDPLLTGVSLVQGRGRARQEQSAHLVTAQRADRTVAKLEAVEALQSRLAADFAASPAGAGAAGAAELAAQRSRERNAAAVLRLDVPAAQALATLNLFCKKTKTEAQSAYDQGRGVYTLSYSSCLRTLVAEQAAPSPLSKAAEKLAKQGAAASLVAQLYEACSKA